SWRRWLTIAGAVLAVGLIVGGVFVHDAEARAGTFFGGGMLLLIAALAAAWGWLRRPVRDHVRPGDPAALTRLGVRNAARNPTRSLLTAALLASAAFLLVAVESFRRSPEADFGDQHGGSGGFALVAETDLPLYRDPNSPEGRQDILDALEKVYQREPATKQKKLTDAQLLLELTRIIPLRLKAGDDTSCLNLYQPGRPRILGVPQSLIDRGGFRFAGTEARTNEERANPWLLLAAPTADGAIPVFGEQHSVQWMLKSDLGGVIEVPDEQGRPVKLRVVGLLQDSVFQSELLMSGSNFLKLYPRQEGFSVFLLDPPAGRRDDVTSLVQTALDSRGVRITPARERLAAYLAVENTYLSTFQVLGGFGLLLGAVGLAVVLLRNVWERRGELALLRALGYRHRALGWLVFAENAALLVLGLAAGVGSAAAAVAPHVLTGEGAVPWGRLAFLLGLVLAVGFAAGGSAVRSTVKAPLVPALRKE
ncbi:MAG TPA: FtsX-like permease family protein, partial [Gemmataceae bacterium]